MRTTKISAARLAAAEKAWEAAIAEHNRATTEAAKAAAARKTHVAAMAYEAMLAGK